MLIGIMLMATFHLGMSVKSAQAICPKPLIKVYEKLHADQYFACDDGSNTTILVFDDNVLVAIMDIRYFARTQG